MSPQDKPVSFMRQLDAWTDKEVIETLSQAFASGSNDEAVMVASDLVRKAIRGKVLESYRNGQADCPADPVNWKRRAKR